MCVCVCSSGAVSSCKQCCLQPPITRGRAETLSPGLLVLSSPGGQKALEPLCQPRRGRGIRKCVAAPKKTNNNNNKRQERKENNEPPANRAPKPKKDRAKAEQNRRKSHAQRAGRKNARQILAGRGKTPQDLREKAAPKSKRKTTCPPRGQKNQPCPVWKPEPNFILTRDEGGEKKEKEREPPLRRNNYSDKADFLKGNNSLTASFGLGCNQTAQDSTKQP